MIAFDHSGAAAISGSKSSRFVFVKTPSTRFEVNGITRLSWQCKVSGGTIISGTLPLRTSAPV